jgi:hypothetical protein
MVEEPQSNTLSFIQSVAFGGAKVPDSLCPRAGAASSSVVSPARPSVCCGY